MASLLIVSCAPSKSDIAGLGEPIQIHLPAGGYQDLAWLPSGWIVADYESDVADIVFRLSAFRPDGRDFRTLPFGDDDECRLTRYSIPQRLPDGRLGLTKECVGLKDSDIDATVIYLAYDMEGDKTEKLAPVVPTWGRHRVNGALVGDENPQSVAWSSNLKTAIFSTGGLCSTLAMLTSHGFSDLPIEISDGEKSWRLEEELHADGSESCTLHGRASYPTWSKNDEIAFFASPKSIGVAGPVDSANQPSNLYVMDAEKWKPREVLADLTSPRSLEWSPDGKWLAFTAGMGGQESALWLFDPSTKTTKRVFEGSVDRATWAPDGQRIAVTESLELEEDAEVPKAKVWIVNVAAVVG